MTLCRRKTDGAMFRASTPDDYTFAQSLADMFALKAEFYFRGIVWQPRRWWQLHGRWVDTGEVWEPTSGEFDVLGDAKKVTKEIVHA